MGRGRCAGTAGRGRPGSVSGYATLADAHQLWVVSGDGRPAPMAPSTNGYAIASLVLSIVTLFGIGSLLGIIFESRRGAACDWALNQSGDGGSHWPASSSARYARHVRRRDRDLDRSLHHRQLGDPPPPLTTQRARGRQDGRSRAPGLKASPTGTGGFPVPLALSAYHLPHQLGVLTAGVQTLHEAPRPTTVRRSSTPPAVWVAPPRRSIRLSSSNRASPPIRTSCAEAVG